MSAQAAQGTGHAAESSDLGLESTANVSGRTQDVVDLAGAQIPEAARASPGMTYFCLSLSLQYTLFKLGILSPLLRQRNSL